MESKLDSLLSAPVKEGKLPSIAAIILDSSGETLYRNAFGVTDITAKSPQAYTASTPTMMFSCTKLVTSIAGLQLIEHGKLRLTDLVETYVPEIKNVQVLIKDEEGNISTRPTKVKPTILHLITHTSGLTYDFFDSDTLNWQIQNGRTPAIYLQAATVEYHCTPLCTDPGEKYTYGIGIDWLGYVIEAVTQVPLDQYIQTNILTPLGMSNTTSQFRPDEDRMFVHTPSPTGLIPIPDLKPSDNPERHGGGAYLISTLDDYSTLLLAVLNNGTHPTTHTRILSSETVERYLFTDHLPEALKSSSQKDPARDVGRIPSSMPQLTNTGTLLPETQLGWSCGLLLNHEDVKNGRRRGSGAWAGLGNLYYWIDREGGRTGLVMTSLIPFFDKTVLEVFGRVEGAAYGGEGVVRGYSVP